MKNIIISLFIISFTFTAQAKPQQEKIDYEKEIYKDFVIEPISFSQSKFNKSFSKIKDYKKFFNTFILDKELKLKLIEKNNLSDVLDTCYNIRLGLSKEIYLNNKNEGEICLKTLALSGSKEAFLYLSILNYDLYKNDLVFNKKNNTNYLMKSVYYNGIANSMPYEQTSEKTDKMTIDFIINNKLTKINNKNILYYYYNNSVLFGLNLPVNYISLSVEENYYSSKTLTFEENLIDTPKVYKDLSRNNFKSFFNQIKELNPKEDINDDNVKNLDYFKNLCSNFLFDKTDIVLPKGSADFCLAQISINNQDKHSAYQLGLYYYALAKAIKTNNPDLDDYKEYYYKSIPWLALSFELGYKESSKILKVMLSSLNKDKVEFLNILKEFNKGRIHASALINKKITK
jgi:hypothetical protein